MTDQSNATDEAITPEEEAVPSERAIAAKERDELLEQEAIAAAAAQPSFDDLWDEAHELEEARQKELDRVAKAQAQLDVELAGAGSQ